VTNKHTSMNKRDELNLGLEKSMTYLNADGNPSYHDRLLTFRSFIAAATATDNNKSSSFASGLACKLLQSLLPSAS
jgi:hypothetical protein